MWTGPYVKDAVEDNGHIKKYAEWGGAHTTVIPGNSVKTDSAENYSINQSGEYKSLNSEQDLKAAEALIKQAEKVLNLI